MKLIKGDYALTIFRRMMKVGFEKIFAEALKVHTNE